MSLRRWNKCRLNQHKTSHLQYFQKYDRMQTTLEEAIEKINSSILSINSKNHVATPKIAQPIMYLRNGHRRCRYGKLPDGVHPNENIKTEWKKIMTQVLKTNRIQKKKSPPKSPPKHSHPISIDTPPPPSPSGASRNGDTGGDGGDTDGDGGDSINTLPLPSPPCASKKGDTDGDDSDTSCKRSWLY